MKKRLEGMRLGSGEKGFALVVVLFILVGLAAIAAAIAILGTVESRRSVLALEGARAYYAARGGLEWGIARAKGGNCAASTSLSVPGAGDFAVTVACSGGSAFTEGGESFKVYNLAVTATGSAGDDPVQRRLEGRVRGPMTEVTP